MKTITLADWLKGMRGCVCLEYAAETPTVFHATHQGSYGSVQEEVGPTPEDALQALAEATCGPDTLLDLGRSEKWQNEHGPDGVDELEKDAAAWRAIREVMHAARGCIGAMPTAQEFLAEYGRGYERIRAVREEQARLTRGLGGIGNDAILGGIGDAAERGNLATARAMEQYLRMQHPGIFPDPDPDAPAGHEVRPIETSMEEESETEPDGEEGRQPWLVSVIVWAQLAIVDDAGIPTHFIGERKAMQILDSYPDIFVVQGVSFMPPEGGTYGVVLYDAEDTPEGQCRYVWPPVEVECGESVSIGRSRWTR